MVITAEWDNEEKTLIRQTYSGRWTWDDIRAMIETCQQMLDSVDHKVNFIGDLRQSQTMLPPSATVQFSWLSNYLRHPKMGKSVIVGASEFIRIFGNMFISAHRGTAEQIVFATTLEEAQAILAKDGSSDEAD
jgi:stage II sporulation SpoAA-like protein